ncbi:hypothetical protein WJ59_20705 [Burkholderia gladioli]|nr:hypothetical protein WJ59_20705 [Burkholderia gladioli]
MLFGILGDVVDPFVWLAGWVVFVGSCRDGCAECCADFFVEMAEDAFVCVVAGEDAAPAEIQVAVWVDQGFEIVAGGGGEGGEVVGVELRDLCVFG